MSTISHSNHRPSVTLNLPRKVPALLVYAGNIQKRMTANPSFPSPTPPLAALSTAIADLQSAETATLQRTKGAAAVRNEKRIALVVLLRQLGAYVQSVVDADPTNGASIIESAGLAVRKTAAGHARTFRVRPGRVSGSASVVAPTAAKRASYEWQYSADGGKTWITAPTSLQARTTVAGLVPGSTVQFKYRAVTKAGEGDWSQPLSLVVS